MSSPLPFTFRPATIADLPAVVAILNANSLATIGTTRTAEHWQHRHWYESGLKLSQDTLVAVNPAGDIAGYAELTHEAPHLIHEVSGAVHPNYRRQGIGTYFLRWAEQRGRQLLPLAPAEARVILRTNFFDGERPAIELFTRNGYQQTRYFVHLRLEMREPPAGPAWPDGIEVRPLEPGDWAKVGPALEEAFLDHWGVPDHPANEEEEENRDGPDHIEKPVFDRDYFNSPGLCFVAWAGDEVAGSCLCNAKTLEWPDSGYLGSLSIRRPWRRQGIGLALTRHALGEFYRRGTRTVLTDTDGRSFTRAYALYHKAGMTLYRQENVYEKELRPGRDYLKRTGS
jgi:ribosomal protein S18 acetylase RimI-like enzyme